jgi:hypothetical protein
MDEAGEEPQQETDRDQRLDESGRVAEQPRVLGREVSPEAKPGRAADGVSGLALANATSTSSCSPWCCRTRTGCTCFGGCAR